MSNESVTDADWLDEAACYFEKRPTGSEDMAFWANVSNAERCRSIAQSLRSKPVAGVEVAANELGDPDEWKSKFEELASWTGSAWIAGEPSEDLRGDCYNFLCTLLGFMQSGEAAARHLSALLPKATAPVVSEPLAWRDVASERQRQKDVEGWTEAHDDQHDRGELAKAGACYALFSTNSITQIEVDGPGSYRVPAHHWPWGPEWWKPSDRRRNLVKAGALILAEIERLDRAALEAAMKED